MFHRFACGGLDAWATLVSASSYVFAVVVVVDTGPPSPHELGSAVSTLINGLVVAMSHN